jgi:hypothetical protein
VDMRDFSIKVCIKNKLKIQFQFISFQIYKLYVFGCVLLLRRFKQSNYSFYITIQTFTITLINIQL